MQGLYHRRVLVVERLIDLQLLPFFRVRLPESSLLHIVAQEHVDPVTTQDTEVVSYLRETIFYRVIVRLPGADLGRQQMRLARPLEPLAHNALRLTLADPPTIRAPDAIQRRGIKIADPQIKRIFDGVQPVLVAVLMESRATQPDDADRLTGTPEGAPLEGKTTIWFPSGSLNQRAGLVGCAEWTSMLLLSRFSR